ncbi:MAG: hypothetical protein MUC62_00080 [Candidatus Thermoplasmatota archaeon]|nr:hypothetical protein [Candidatus Thermoplasmatota archaeon]
MNPFLVLIVASLVFIGGCVIAVLREGISDSDEDMTRSSVDILEVVIGTYGSEGGPISLTLFVSEPGLLLSRSELNGRTGRSSLTVVGLDTHHIYFPDEEGFVSTGTSSAKTYEKSVAVSIGDGRVVLGSLEVVIVG